MHWIAIYNEIGVISSNQHRINTLSNKWSWAWEFPSWRRPWGALRKNCRRSHLTIWHHLLTSSGFSISMVKYWEIWLLTTLLWYVAVHTVIYISYVFCNLSFAYNFVEAKIKSWFSFAFMESNCTIKLEAEQNLCHFNDNGIYYREFSCSGNILNALHICTGL